MLWRLVETDGDVLGEGLIEGAGSMGVVDDFGHDVSLPPGTHARGAHVVLQVFGDDPSGEHPPGTDLVQVPRHPVHRPARLPAARGRPGGHAVAVARDQGQDTTADDVFEANRDTVMDPDRIFPGQVLRVPLF